jgi:hypothetical protein
MAVSGRFVMQHLLVDEQHRRALEALRREGVTPPTRDRRQETVVVADSTPLALVEEYLRRDARGEFTRASEWLFEVALYALNYAWEAATVISSYEILATEATGNTTRIAVRYDVIGGFVSAGPDGVPMWSLTDSVELQTFVVVRTERGFRLAGPALNPHMSARTVLEGGHRPDLEGRVDRCVLVEVRREPHIASARGLAAAGVLARE